jgi:hypothetical protein
LADVFAGRAEDLAVDVDLASATAMPQPSSDRSSDGITACFADPLVQIEVAHGVGDDGRAEHLLLLFLDELPQVHVGIGERRGIRSELGLDQPERAADIALPVEAHR